MGNLKLISTGRRTSIGEPFPTSTACWFWCVACLTARAEGARFEAGKSAPKPCEPDDVVREIVRLVHRRRLRRAHVRILMEYGRMGRAPSPHARGEEANFSKLWREAFERLTPLLRAKGIVQ